MAPRSRPVSGPRPGEPCRSRRPRDRPFLFWDGRKDSQWAQALGPLESAVEHGGTRAQYAHVIAEHYARSTRAIFGALPDLTRVPVAAGPVDEPRRGKGLDGAHRITARRRDAGVCEHRKSHGGVRAPDRVRRIAVRSLR